MAMNKIERIDKEIAKTREKITEYQNRLRGLEAQKTEAENLQIVQLVRSMRLSPHELSAMLSGWLPLPVSSYEGGCSAQPASKSRASAAAASVCFFMRHSPFRSTVIVEDCGKTGKGAAPEKSLIAPKFFFLSWFSW